MSLVDYFAAWMRTRFFFDPEMKTFRAVLNDDDE